MEHDTSPNFSGVVHLHPLYVVVAHKSKTKVSSGVAQTGGRLLWTMPLNSLETYKR